MLKHGRSRESFVFARFNRFFENWMDQAEIKLCTDRNKICCVDFLANWYTSDFCRLFNDSKGSCENQVERGSIKENGLLGFSDEKGFSCLADHPVYFSWTFSTS